MAKFLLLVAFIFFLSTIIFVASRPAVSDVASGSVIRITGKASLDEGIAADYTCTGFQIAPNRVLTAAHCVGDVEMQADGKTARPLKVDTNLDLALILVPSDKPALILRDRPVEKFEALTSIGYAWGWDKLTVLEERAFLIDFSVGTGSPVGTIVQGGYIGGMSGGPLIDSRGEVVGIIQRSREGIGYGVGVLMVRAFLLGEDLLVDPPAQTHPPVDNTYNLRTIPFFNSPF